MNRELWCTVMILAVGGITGNCGLMIADCGLAPRLKSAIYNPKSHERVVKCLDVILGVCFRSR